MYNLFYISNYIVLNNYLNIINSNKIPLNKCLFYSPRLNYEDMNLSIRINLIDLNSINCDNKLTLIKKLKKHTLGERYVLFVPHFINKREKILVNSRFCTGYNLVEEGYPAYTLVTKDNKLNYFPRNIFRDKYIQCYGNNKLSFDGLKNKIVMPLKFKHIQKKEVHFFVPDNANIIAIDSLKIFENAQNYLFSLVFMFQLLSKNNKRNIYLKYHPDYNSSPKFKDNIEHIAKTNKLNPLRLPNNVFIEELVNSNHVYNIYNVASSLLIYVAKSKSNIYLFPSILRKDSTFNEVDNYIKGIIQKLNLTVKEVDLDQIN